MNRDLIHLLDRIEEGDQIFLDYDGTLVPIVMDPEKCFLPAKMIEILKELDHKYELYIVSGRTLEDLKRFTGLELKFVYLHGLAISDHGEIRTFIPDPEKYNSAFNTIRKEMSLMSYAGLRIYDKQYGLVFHTGLVPDHMKNEIEDRVRMLAKENDLEVYKGTNLVEIKIKGVNKGVAIRKLRTDRKCLIAGDEKTDEYAFTMCPECINIHVGNSETAAKFRVSDISEMENVLEYLAYKP